jgi:hypothetical protein
MSRSSDNTFSVIAETQAKEIKTALASEKNTDHAPTPTNIIANQKQDDANRLALLGTQIKPTPKERLANALVHYEKAIAAEPSPPTEQSLFEKIAARLRPPQDPNIQKFNDLQLLYATAMHICPTPLNQVISANDMQKTTEDVWRTGKIDVGTLELFETAILSVVKNKLEM